MLNMNEIAARITKAEGKKRILNIGDVKEVLKIINDRTAGVFYKWARANFK